MKEFQYNFSDKNHSMYDKDLRLIKANKTLSVLGDYLGELSNLKLLDIGCSSGIMTYEYAKFFKNVIGIDLDKKAVEFAKKNKQSENIKYFIGPIEESNFDYETFDVITCSHIYEHVPSSNDLIDEIYNLLKPGGVCYFAAGNRYNLNIIEAHYRLPFLSFLPKKIANIYIGIFRKEKAYYETHLSLTKLRKLVGRFDIEDYSLKILRQPKKFFATDMLTENTIKYYAYNLLGRLFYYFFPTYIWILKKAHHDT